MTYKIRARSWWSDLRRRIRNDMIDWKACGIATSIRLKCIIERKLLKANPAFIQNGIIASVREKSVS
jgi:hypothetical protein